MKPKAFLHTLNFTRPCKNTKIILETVFKKLILMGERNEGVRHALGV